MNLQITRIKTILLVDDCDDAFLFKCALKKLGVPKEQVFVVESGDAAIEFLEGKGSCRSRPFPDILFLDLKMPGTNGWEVLQWMSENPEFRVFPTVVLSCSAEHKDVEHAFHTGATCYLSKPVDIEEFTKMVERTLQFWGSTHLP